MANRLKLLIRLNSISANLRNELEYYLSGVEHGCYYDTVDALDDYLNIVLNGNPNKELKHIFLDVNYVEPVDLKNTFVTHGKKYWFKLNGIAYNCVLPFETWINQ